MLTVTLPYNVYSLSVLISGLEDYFSYAHGFALAENTTYAYVGNYHAAPQRKEPLTWHCYRHHVLDPVPFQSDVMFIMEGNDRYITYCRLQLSKFAESTVNVSANLILRLMHRNILYKLTSKCSIF